MRNQTFHWEIRTIIAMFEDAFNDVVINRYNDNKDIEDQIHVNFRYAPKTRVIQDLVNLNQHIKLPCIAIVPGTLRRDTNRVFNKIDGSYHTDSNKLSAWVHLLQPVPVNLDINMSIIGRFQQDIDQILTNFIPYCDPYVVISWKWPDIIPWNDFEIRSHVKWNEQVSFQYPVDIANNLPYQIIADTSFTIETWMFKNSPNVQGPIYVINHSFTSLKELDTFEVMKTEMNDNSTENWVTSGRPFIYQVSPFEVFTSDTVSTSTELIEFNLLGSMFDYTKELYLSGSPGVFDMSWTPTTALSTNPFYFDPFGTVSSLSAFYPPFSGIMIPSGDWTILDKNTITFFASALSAGYFDIIAVNAAGYGKLTTDSIRLTLNPYPSSMPQYAIYETYQPPYTSGVQIKQLG
jgi:hypothetical protein